MICSSDNGSLRLSFKYCLSLYAIDLIIPLVIQFDFLCLCLLNSIVLEGKCLFIALVTYGLFKDVVVSIRVSTWRFA